MVIIRTELQKKIIVALWWWVENARISGFTEMHGDEPQLETEIGEIQTVMEIQFSWFLPYESDDIRAKLESVLKEYISSHDNDSTLDLEYQNGKWFIYLNS